MRIRVGKIEKSIKIQKNEAYACICQKKVVILQRILNEGTPKGSLTCIK